jgi:hypothetical protein
MKLDLMFLCAFNPSLILRETVCIVEEENG